MDNRSNSLTTVKPARCLFVTLGCAKNEVDTDRMRARLLAAGFGEAMTVDEADVASPEVVAYAGIVFHIETKRQ